MRASIPAVHQTRSTPVMNDFQALYQSLVETLPVHIFCKDEEGGFNFGNSSYCAELGEPLSEILGNTDRDFFPSALPDKYRRDDQQVVPSGQVFETVEEDQIPTVARTYVH